MSDDVVCAPDVTAALPTGVVVPEPLAWSQAPDGNVVPYDAPGWSGSARWLLAAAAAAAGVLAVGVVWSSRPAPSVMPVAPPTTSVAAAPPVTVTVVSPAPATAVAALTPDAQDRQFLALARLDGVYNTVMANGGVSEARRFCKRLGVELPPPGDNETPRVFDILDVYCPEFDLRGSDKAAANVLRAALGVDTAPGP